MTIARIVVALAPLAASCAASPEVPHRDSAQSIVRPAQPVEWGRVHWIRDLDAGLERAKRESKPALVLFQEVPG